MSLLLFSNRAVTTIAGAISTGATSVNLAAGTGTMFPHPGAGQYFILTFVSQSSATVYEIVNVTAVSGDTLTIVRGQEGTAALAWNAGDTAANYWTAASANAMVQVAQLQQQAGNYAADTGAVNAYAVTLTPAPASLASIIGSPIRVKIANTNTGASTLAVNGLGATVITGVGGAALLNGTLLAGQIATFVYDGTNFEYHDVLAVGGQLSGSLPIPSLAAGAAVTNLGFTPVQQGGGAGQTGTTVYLGYDGVATLLAQAGAVNLGPLVLRSMSNFLTTSTDVFDISLPGQNGVTIHIVMGTATINNTGTGSATTDSVALATAFKTSFVGAMAGFLGTTPPYSGSVSAYPTNLSSLSISVNGSSAGNFGVWYLAFGF